MLWATLIPFTELTFLEYFSDNNERKNELVDENDNELEIYQFFFINDSAAEQIIKDNTYNVYYNEMLNVYFITIHHFGAHWSTEKVSVFRNIFA